MVLYAKSLSSCLIKICLLHCLTAILSGQARDQPDLYSPSHDVIRLNGKTFEPTLFKQNKDITFVVQFYNTFCGHCQTFAPIYKELATRIKNWSSVVKVAGVDCSKYENVETCSENKIAGYPTIFIFPPNSKFKDPKDAPFDLRSVPIEWNVDDIEETIITYIGNLTKTDRHYPKAVDALQPVTVTELSHVKRLYPVESDFDGYLSEQNSLQDLMFIIEDEKSFIGRKLIIEYFRINSKLELRRILLSNDKLLEKILDYGDYQQLKKTQPLLVRINSLNGNAKSQVLVKGEVEHVLPTVDDSERHDFILKRFKDFLDHYYSVELKEIVGYDVDVSKKSDKTVTNTIEASGKMMKNFQMEIDYLLHHDPIGSTKIFAQDILKGISYMLTHEIRIKGDISPVEYTTVRNLLTILKKFLPIDKWDPTFGKFLDSLRTKLDENRLSYDKSGITSQQMKDLLDYSGSDEIRMKYNDQSWLSCYESDRQHKGYTCSLWLLFHTLTVGEYSKSAPIRTKPRLVLTTMRDYITKFLGCTVCSSNFAKETENLESELTHRSSCVTWLWHAHNRVNQRLNNEKPESERQPLSQIIYPSQERCRDCYITRLSEIGSDGKTLGDIEWQSAKVLEYLVQLYKPDHVVSPIELSLLLRTIRSKTKYDIIEGVNGDIIGPHYADLNSSSADKWNIQSIFSTSDMSLCLILYLSCIVIVGIVCFFLNPKWKRASKIK